MRTEHAFHPGPSEWCPVQPSQDSCWDKTWEAQAPLLHTSTFHTNLTKTERLHRSDLIHHLNCKARALVLVASLQSSCQLPVKTQTFLATLDPLHQFQSHVSHMVPYSVPNRAAIFSWSAMGLHGIPALGPQVIAFSPQGILIRNLHCKAIAKYNRWNLVEK